mgnify:CR=1 FL=1
MTTILITLLAIGGIFFTLLGMFVTYHIVRKQKLPADESNRINKIRLIWFVLTRENLFTETFPWMKNDELKNVTKS